MTGGELQLATYGAEDYFLTGNPQISFFKKTYRRYTNFSMESKTLDFEGNTKLLMDSNLKLRCKLPRYGDLVSNMYFTFTLPDIYSYDSSRYFKIIEPLTVSAADSWEYRNQKTEPSWEFAWIEDIGNSIIDNVSISIGGTIIDKHYGEWLRIWNQISKEEYHPNALYEDHVSAKWYNAGAKQLTHNIYNRLIGNTSELKWPEFGNNRGSGMNSSRYPTTFYTTRHDGSVIDYPSIERKKIYVPLRFWFNNNPSLALPLISLLEQDIYINIELRQLIDLYTLFTSMEEPETLTIAEFLLSLTPGDSEYFQNGKFIRKPKMNISSDNIGQFLRPIRTVTYLDIEPHLEVNYIFLSKEERIRYMNMDFEYLIETNKRFKSESNHNNTVNMILELNNPVKDLVWMAKRDDIEEANYYNNYTNWLCYWAHPSRTDRFNGTRGFIPSADSMASSIEFEMRNNGEFFFPTPNQVRSTSDKYLQRDIITNTSIRFNGVNRINKPANYFQYLQPYQTKIKEMNDVGIYIYSFELSNQYSQDNQYQPTGSCNMGKINKIEMQFEINPPPPKPYTNLDSDVSTKYWYRYDIHVYAVSYNVLKISGGMAQLEYQS